MTFKQLNLAILVTGGVLFSAMACGGAAVVGPWIGGPLAILGLIMFVGGIANTGTDHGNQTRK